MDEGSPPPTAVASGNNAYSSLYLASSLLVWDKMEARERDVASERIKRPVEEEGVGFELAELLARLKLCPKPTTMWLNMSKEAPDGARKEAVEAHRYFCRIACDISAIVGHTCGVERAGKAYKLVMTSHRKLMDPKTTKKAVFILSNYGLLHKEVDMGDGLSDFSGSLLMDEDASIELQAKRLHGLRRHVFISDEELAAGEEGGDSSGGSGSGGAADEGEEGEEGEQEGSPEEYPAQREVKWSALPEG